MNSTTTTTTTTVSLSPWTGRTTSSPIKRAAAAATATSLPPPYPSLRITTTGPKRHVVVGGQSIRCEVTVNDTPSPSTTATATITSNEAEEDSEGVKKVGARVRVKVPLTVYHVPRVPEMNLVGREGVVKQYVGVWKGKRISANLPFKIEFVVDNVEGRNVKFFAHLKEDEFDFID